MVSTKETAEMERAIAALALELPGEVWDDVRAKWHAARDSLGAEVERLGEGRDLIRRLAVELEAMNARHGCGQIECSIAMEAVAEARRVLGLRRNEPFPIGSTVQR